jgi:pimeloyl-ACP methyl ester carboxylesterase
MCGICGLVWFDPAKPVDACLVDRMTSTLVHRGPDADGRWVDRNAGLGFRRLSIIDLSDRGNQPFANEAGAIHLVCNGEIYNSGKLRRELIVTIEEALREQDALNRWPHFKARVRDLDIHFIHVRSNSDKRRPLLITHGWPGSIVEFLNIIEPLAFPEKHAGKASDAFDLVIPSLPGYGFSGKPAKPVLVLASRADSGSIW